MPATIAPAAYPKPQLVHDHNRLFVEPAYPDGQPYAGDEPEDDDPED